MWELIKANHRKSLLIFFLMGALLIGLGWAFGSSYRYPEGGYAGIFFAGVIWFILTLIAYFTGDSVILSAANAKEVTPAVHPQLFNVVEEMKIAASLPKMPKVYIINDPAPNAFATGRSPERCAVAVTAGLLTKLNRDELQGVIAHEVSHITNRDVMFMTFAGVMLGTIVLLSEVFLRSLWFSGGGGRYRSSDSRGGGQAQLIIMVAAIALAILAPLLARMFYFAISRKREFLADASAVRLTRYPEGLASALEKISRPSVEPKKVDSITAPMYIENPRNLMGLKPSSLFNTHPPIDERIKILRGMTHGANYADYQQAYSSVKGAYAHIIPQSELGEKEAVPLRQAAVGLTAAPAAAAKSKHRELGDIMHSVNGYRTIPCRCGLKLKIPPNYKNRFVVCPRCQTRNVLS